MYDVDGSVYVNFRMPMIPAPSPRIPLPLYTYVLNPLRFCLRGTELSAVRSLHSKSLLPREVAPIADRLRPDMNFGEFTEATFAAYY